jgi:hypothetical protein
MAESTPAATRARTRNARAIKRAFLRVLPEALTITAAAEALRIERTKIYRLMRADPGFMRAVEDAMFEARWAARDEAFRRAVNGVPEPVVQGGKVVEIVNPATGQLQPLTLRRYSDLLLRDFLRAGWPELFKQQFHAELSTPPGRPLALQASRAPAVDLGKLSLPELEQLEGLLAKAQPQALPAPEEEEDEEPRQ